MIDSMYLPRSGEKFCINWSIGRLNMDLKMIIGQNMQIIGFIGHFKRKYRTNSFFTHI